MTKEVITIKGTGINGDKSKGGKTRIKVMAGGPNGSVYEGTIYASKPVERGTIFQFEIN